MNGTLARRGPRDFIRPTRRGRATAYPRPGSATRQADRQLDGLLHAALQQVAGLVDLREDDVPDDVALAESADERQQRETRPPKAARRT